MTTKYLITLKENVANENVSLDLRLKKPHKTRNYFILDEIKHNDLMNEKHIKVCKF